MKILRMLAVLVGITSAQLLSNVGDQLVAYSNVLNTFCPLLPDTIKEGAKPGAKSARARCKTLVSVGSQAGNVANDVEYFKDAVLPTITAKGDELIARLHCMDKNQMGNPTCKALGCTDDNACIALILKDTKNLLEPIMSTLVAGQTQEAKTLSQQEKKAYYDKGALYRLASLSALPEATSTKIKTQVAAFAERINSSLEFMNALATLLSPQAVIAASPELPAEKKAEIAKIEPLPKLEVKAEESITEPHPVAEKTEAEVIPPAAEIPQAPELKGPIVGVTPRAPVAEQPAEIPQAPALEEPIVGVTPRAPVEKPSMPAAPSKPVMVPNEAAPAAQAPVAPPLDENFVPGVAGKGMGGKIQEETQERREGLVRKPEAPKGIMGSEEFKKALAKRRGVIEEEEPEQKEEEFD